MILYHGSYCTVDKPNISYSRDSLDFGKEFYLTDIKNQDILNKYLIFNDCEVISDASK